MSEFGVIERGDQRDADPEANENGLQNHPINFTTPFPPPRTPLNTIPDPSQFSRDFQSDSKAKFESATAHHRLNRVLDKKVETWIHGSTPRGRGKVQLEPNSAQSTPARSVSKSFNNGGVLGVCSGYRLPQDVGARGGGNLSKVYRGVSIAPAEPSIELVAPHFELVEDPSFWTDHNVQVMIRIRPLSSTERALQGYNRCLRQESANTLTWLGHPETRFTFDNIACEMISQEKLFNVAGLPMVENCMSGYNSCMFAYGQTGSGKTYTMMGEILDMDGELNKDCGITPRIFEYLFMRIKAEEEHRRDEKLKYSCKCSFLEIYNEQITDLLEPSSTNLQLREDTRKGVHVENLTEYEVTTVKDVLQLLLKGATNRKMAATNMNSESSRSHSVFTCTIESRWVIDSMTHFRFGRLNLVDLAGSERQKSSGAEGERLKEAANINKSLSTLGLVIMTLVDVAHGKIRHVPYRDSRLTFLLQDSLGGNSKTTIIANISPSICSANETLSTLKFAQRAKLIQNNAKVNEDASGDVVTLQRQIQQLKDQLTFLLRNQDFSRSQSLSLPSFEQSQLNDICDLNDSSRKENTSGRQNITSISVKEIRCNKATLVGALRREKMAEIAVRRLEAEIEQMSRLVHQYEEDAQRSKMILRFREEKIKRLELLTDGLISTDEYLVEENSALSKEIQLIEARLDKNPELIRFAMENIRLLEQLRVFQDFYERGEKETLLAEVSELRDQLTEILEANHEQLGSTLSLEKNEDIVQELEACRGNLDRCLEINVKLTREVDELRKELNKHINCSRASLDIVADALSMDAETTKETEKQAVEIVSAKADSEDEAVSCWKVKGDVLQTKNDQKMGHIFTAQHNDTQKELLDAKSLIEAMEYKKLHLIEELDTLRKKNFQCMELWRNKDFKEMESIMKPSNSGPSEMHQKVEDLHHQEGDLLMELGAKVTMSCFQAKLDKMTMDLEEARILNRQYQDDQQLQLFHEKEAEQVRRQVEEETAKTILHLQELVMLQEELQEKLNALAEENIKLRNIVTTREGEMRMLSEKWEKATLELTSFIIDGCRSLEDASEQIESIKNSFPESEDWISEHVDRAAKIIAEKEKTIAQLQMSLEDAQKMGLEMKLNLSSLKGATLAITELQQLETDENTKEAIQLRELLSDKILTIQELHDKLKIKENQMNEAKKCATAAFEAAKRLTDLRSDIQNAGEIPDPESLFAEFDEYRISDVISELDAQAREAIKLHVEMVRRRIFETENAINVSYMDTGNHLSALISGILDTFFTFLKLIMNFIVGTPMKKKLMEFKEQNIEAQHDKVMHQVRSGLCVMNDRLISISKHIDATCSAQVCSGMVGNIAKIDTLSSVQLMPCSGLSHENIFPKGVDETSSYSYNSGSTEKLSEMSDIDSIHSASTITIRDLKNFHNPKDNFICCTGAILDLREEMESTFNSFLKIHLQLTKLVHDGNSLNNFGTKCFHESNAHKHQDQVNADDKEKINQPSVLDVARKLQSLHLPAEEAEAECSITREMLHLKLNDVRLVADEKVKTACSFFHKFEEAHATLKEADLMLNELLQANEDAKHMTDQWKQAGEELMIDKALLIKEVQQLKSSISLKERDYDVLQDQLRSSLLEVANSVSSLEGSFLQMQIDVDERFMILHSDVFSLGRDLLNCIHSLRSSLEKMWSEILEKGFTLFVLRKCYTESCCEKLSGPNSDSGFAQGGIKGFDSVNNNVGKEHMIIKEGSHMFGVGNIKEENIKEETNDNRFMLQSLSNPGDVLDAKNALGTVATLNEEAVGRTPDSVISEKLSLQRELARKDVLLKGLLFDLRLLQESTSNVKDFKDRTEQMFQALTMSQHELSVKAAQLDDILLQHRKLETQLADKEVALSISNSKLAHANETLDMLSKKNAELRIILEEVYAKQASTEEQLEEKKEAIKGLEKEILCVAFSVEEKVVSSIQAIECELSRVILERDRLREEVASLNDKLEMANALADENEAMAVEARQESEASKVYAEQKEEEAKILENSVEELEHTVDVLEKKVHEMGKEVERHRLTRDNLELELQDLRLRMVTVESVTESIDVEGSDVEQLVEDDSSRLREGRKRDLLELRKQMRILEREKADQAKEIKECRDYISELVLHAEAQASQYQQKYKALEAMVREVQRDPSTSTCATSGLDKTEKNSTRTRGSSSPFRCLTNLVQQMNLEKDQDLSVARLRIEELEALASSRQKEVCRLNARLAATENMTHDVIRDLLGVKLDMTNYANLIDQYHVQRLIEEAQQRSEESSVKDQEIVKLRKEIDELVAEKQSCVDEISRRQADLLESQLMVEQLQYRDQMLTAQNEMLKVDKANLKRKITEMDEMVKKHSRLQRIQPRILQPLNIKDNIRLRAGNDELSRRLTNSEKLLSRVNDELAQYRTSDGIDPYNKIIEDQRVRNK